ncbi:radical SAM domain protein, partial [mine drainage metagenome]
MGIFYINIGGGEPTIRRDFLEILRHADSIGIGIKFSTNGSFIDDGFARELRRFRYTDVQISIDGPDRQSNDLIRGAGSFDRAL